MDRKKTIASIRADLDWVEAHRSKYDDEGEPFIVGYDMVSEEDRGWSTADVAEAFFTEDGKKRDVPFFLHDGESCWADNDNLFADNGTSFLEHVSMWEVRGVKFNGCVVSK